MLKICFIDTLGLPYDGSTPFKRGLGGSESATVYISRELAKIGFDVTIFNDCEDVDVKPGTYDSVTYLPLSSIPTTGCDWDIVVSIRSIAPFAPDHIKPHLRNVRQTPDLTNLLANAKRKILMMHDTFCDGDIFIEELVVGGLIDELFTLSDWHTSYVGTCNHGKYRIYEVLKNHMFQTRNGVNIWNKHVDISKKDYNHFVYNASVTKGMLPLVKEIWPRVLRAIPDAKLTVIGGFYRFKSTHGPDQQEQDWHKLVEEYSSSVKFTGVISQKEISDILSTASWMIYPCDFPETFGISTLEAIAHNVPVLTCRFGALEETALDSCSYKIPYSVVPNWSVEWLKQEEQVEKFVKMVIDAYNVPYLHQQKMYACNAVKNIVSWDTVALQWKQHIFTKLGLYLPIDEYRRVQDINYTVAKTFGRRFTNLETLSTPQRRQKKISVVTAMYNAEQYISRAIESVVQQDYDNYEMIVVDDCSTDDSVAAATSVIEKMPYDLRSKFRLIANQTNVGAVKNHWDIFRSLDTDIVMLLDGDDSLVNDPTIFHKYNNMYHEGAEFTYGSCWSVVDKIPLVAQQYPENVKQARNYRSHKFNWNMPYTHLRTFDSSLIPLVHNDELLVGGSWPKAGGDTATFYALIEKADPSNVIAVPDVVYNYNDAIPTNDYKINGEEQTRTANAIINKRPVVKERFSVVVPTMWRCADVFKNALQQYALSPYVDDIHIINNAVELTPDWDILNHRKIRVHNQTHNIKVNPAWNLGVSLAKQPRVAIVNDDILFDPHVFERLQGRITPSTGVHGIISGEAIFNQPLTTDGSIDFQTWKPGDIIHCFGQAMFLHKANWINVPEGLQIYFGDDVIMQYHLHRGVVPVMIYNINFLSPMAATSKDKTLTEGFYEKELPVYQAWSLQYPWTVQFDPEGKQIVKNEIEVAKPLVSYSYEIPQASQTKLSAERQMTETTKNKKVLIAIPCKNDIEADTFKAIYDQEIPDGVSVDFQYFYGYAVDQVRNLIANWVINGYDYLFAVDHDMVFPADTLKRLLAHDKDIVSALYRQRAEVQHLEAYDLNFHRLDGSTFGDELVEIGGCGFGCVLVKREVFEAVGYPQFVYHQALNHEHTFSEDLDFCRKALGKGYKVYLDPTIYAHQIGSKLFVVDLPKNKKARQQIVGDPVRQRLRELRNMDLLPQKHKDYLVSINNGGIKPKVVYDIGACVLHWTDFARTVWPDATFVAFEAMRETEFLYTESGMPYVCGAPLYHTDGLEMEFHQNLTHPGGNSLYKENNKFSQMADILYNNENVQKKLTATLDTVVAHFNFPPPDLIKIDVQGAELDVLKGGINTLMKCRDLILEMQHVEYNKGAPQAVDVVSFLLSIGFVPVGEGAFNVGDVDGDYHFVNSALVAQ